MKPDQSILKVSEGSLAAHQVLAERGTQYAIYLKKCDKAKIEVQIPDGNYTAEWVNTISGKVDRTENLTAVNGILILTCTEMHEDIAVRILKAKN